MPFKKLFQVQVLSGNTEVDFSSNDKRVFLIILAVFCILCMDAATTLIEIDRLVAHRMAGFMELAHMIIMAMITVLGLILAAALVFWKRYSRWLRNLLVFGIASFSITTTVVLDYDVAWYFLIPTLVSCLYYRPRYTLCISLFMLLMIPLVIAAKELFEFAWESVDNLQYVSEHTLWEGVVRVHDLNRFSIDIVVIDMIEIAMEMSICLIVAFRGRWLSIEQARSAAVEGRIQRELEIAERIQTGLHPVQSLELPQMEISASMVAAASVGGDLYDFFRIDDTHICLAIADVSGNGVPAAIFAAAVKTLIHAYAQSQHSPDAVMEQLNAYLCQYNTQKLFVTVWIGIVDIDTGLVTYCNAGHNPPCILRKGQSSEYIQMVPNFIVARRNNIKYKSETIRLNPGDILYLYTDGITEANNGSGQLFGAERLLEVLNQCGDSMPENLEKIKSAVLAFADHEPQADDMTMVMLQYKSVQQD